MGATCRLSLVNSPHNLTTQHAHNGKRGEGTPPTGGGGVWVWEKMALGVGGVPSHRLHGIVERKAGWVLCGVGAPRLQRQQGFGCGKKGSGCGRGALTPL